MSQVCFLFLLLSRRNAADGPRLNMKIFCKCKLSSQQKFMFWIYDGEQGILERMDFWTIEAPVPPVKHEVLFFMPACVTSWGLEVETYLMTHLDRTPPGLWWHTHSQIHTRTHRQWGASPVIFCLCRQKQMFLVWRWAPELAAMMSWPPLITCLLTNLHTHTHTHLRFRHFTDVWIIANQSEVNLHVWTSLRFSGKYSTSLLVVLMKVKLQTLDCFTISPSSQHRTIRKCTFVNVQWTKCPHECVVVHNSNVMNLNQVCQVFDWPQLFPPPLQNTSTAR